jgi:hypothetical protein
MECDLKVVRIQTQQPSRDCSNPGKIEEAMYAVDDGYVPLYSMDGLSMGPGHRRKLPPHLTPNEWAARCCGRLFGKDARTSIARYATHH